jgi:hypothetical protein
MQSQPESSTSTPRSGADVVATAVVAAHEDAAVKEVVLARLETKLTLSR